MWILWTVLALVLLASIAAPLLCVDDWRRDFTTNYAETSETGDAELRPLAATLAPRRLADVVEQAARGLPRWQVVDREESGEGYTLRLVRTTPVLRFQDDITIHITPTGEGSSLRAESRSRMGRGDLGQNPRNLKELLAAVRRRLAAIANSRPAPADDGNR